MTISPKYLLTYLEASQSQKHISVNEGFRRIEALTQIVIIDRDLTAPPGSPANLDAYIPKATATGDWTGAEDDIAFFDLDEWVIVPPSTGLRVYIDDENIWLYWTGSVWAALPGATMTGRVYGQAALDNTITRVQTFGPGVTKANTGGSEATYEIAGGPPVIIDMTLTAPPGSPSADDMYVVAPTATGDWSGQEDDIARFFDDTVTNGWEFYTPFTGMQIKDLNTNLNYEWTGTLWAVNPLEPHWDEVSFLTALDGADLATSAVDDSNTVHTITFNGNAKLITAQKKFGTASVDFDGTGDYLSIPDHADFNFGKLDFTIEFWVRFTAEPGSDEALIAKWDTSGDDAWMIQYNPTTNVMIGFVSTTGSDFPSAGFDFDIDDISVANFFNSAFHHIALIRASDKIYMYVDGIRGSTVATVTVGLFANTSVDVTIGARRTGAGVSNEMTGQVDEIRITKGFARYTGMAFIIPTKTFPRG